MRACACGVQWIPLCLVSLLFCVCCLKDCRGRELLPYPFQGRRSPSPDFFVCTHVCMRVYDCKFVVACSTSYRLKRKPFKFLFVFLPCPIDLVIRAHPPSGRKGSFVNMFDNASLLPCLCFCHPGHVGCALLISGVETVRQCATNLCLFISPQRA